MIIHENYLLYETRIFYLYDKNHPFPDGIYEADFLRALPDDIESGEDEYVKVYKAGPYRLKGSD